ELDDRGNLLLRTAGGDVVEHAPVIYQESNDTRQMIAGASVLHGEQVGFAVGPYDPARPLVIDPVLSYSTYLGGSGIGSAPPPTPPTAPAHHGALTPPPATAGSAPARASPGPCQSRKKTPHRGVCAAAPPPTAFPPLVGDAFVTKLDPAGTAIVYSTYLGG